MKNLFLGMLVLTSIIAHAQSFQLKKVWKENVNVNSKSYWVDFDNDSLMDVVVIGKSSNTTSRISWYKNNEAKSFALTRTQTEDMIPTGAYLTDFNQDNRMDLLLTGIINGKAGIRAVINKANLSMRDSMLVLPDLVVTSLITQDFDFDGKLDLAVGGADFLKVFKNTGNSYQLKFDSLGISVKSLASCDYDRDGRYDLIVSGTKGSQPILFFMKNLSNLKFKKTNLPSPTTGIIENGDFKHDGKFDLVVNGRNANQQSQLQYFKNTGKAFQATDSIPNYKSGQLLLADLNSDGLSELSFAGRMTDGKRANQIIDSIGFIMNLDTARVHSQQWGDYDRDGDLDVLRVLDSASYFVYQVWENKETKTNLRPTTPGRTFSVNIFNRTILYWDKSIDDHTPQKSLTYDIGMYDPEKSKYFITPDFDGKGKRRLRSSHGNQTTNNVMMLPLLPGNFQYQVQAVDNSFNGSKCISGTCSGNPCADFKIEYEQLCISDPVEIKLDKPVYWFSFKDGFLGESDKVTVDPTSADTLVSIDPTSACGLQAKVYKINQLTKTESATKYVCADQPIKLGIEPGWQSPIWKWDSSTSTGDTVLLSTQKNTVVTVGATKNICTYKKEFTIRISTPNLKLNGDYFKIKEGESVALEASGAQTYHWTPATGLSNALSSATLASPLQTTTYQVVAKDSIQCEARANVTVEVEETAFVATLFTPNGDGKNDEVKIYGLTAARELRFLIYNRDGVLVYESTSLSQATAQGWNGTTNGTQQSAGVYYWKIEGTLPNGQPLRLNGKTKGSILLVR
ncbi:MAG: T9SS type B sorting domain-containing protein [Cyclobacteriaceae bacterium]|nr:T9SS type B sorting domain-containing protein [Cyclobacteriaceae bacterium]